MATATPCAVYCGSAPAWFDTGADADEGIDVRHRLRELADTGKVGR